MKPWVEKYRPMTMNDLTHQKEVFRIITHAVRSGNLPHLIFHGPPGTGKTSTIHAFTHMVFPKRLRNDYVLELNASDERCINTVRYKIKDFSKRSVRISSGVTFPSKIVILDEADTMTPDAQSALRRIIEDYASTTRFCLVCNYVSRIMDPLLSRCAKIRFVPIPKDGMVSRLEYICHSEGITIDSRTLTRISDLSEGDMRRGIFALQMAHSMSERGSPIDESLLGEICGRVDSGTMTSFWNTVSMRNFNDARAFVDNFLGTGYPVTSLLREIKETIVSGDRVDIDDFSRARMCHHMANAEKNLMNGSSEYLQLLSFIGTMMT